ncbi:4058_t:CDS:2 [Gigaspora margarita]|uniref:4058_t:CDS:1 n=1 Tax=Gigaspora margarita TaxID=4874 RepID=A0ABN7W1R3_GIGMA|nr:4058_t:CDS:2 [Gigaspora margarita]
MGTDLGLKLDICSAWLTKENLAQELKDRNIKIDEKAKKDDLVKILEEELNKKTLKIKLDNRDVDIVFPLVSGWALKEVQKFGKKGASKRMMSKVRTLLEEYFLVENINKSDRYIAQDMYQELQNCAQKGKIDAEEVSKLTMIQN